MSAIQKLNQGTLTLASSLPFYDPNNGSDRRASVADLGALLAQQEVQDDGFITQYESPSATGFNVTVAPFVAGGNVWVLLAPLAGYAAGTITLPSNPTNAQKVLVHCRQAVTTLTVAANGSLVVSGAPTTLAAGGFFEMRYDGVTRGWYRVG
jgi:hypothetical protein